MTNRVTALALALAAACSLAWIGPLAAEAPTAAPAEPPGANEPARYSFTPVEGGVLRLDTRTGAMASCTRRVAGWACETVPEERAALEAEIARLSRENERLAGRVAALEKQIEARRIGPPPVPPGEVPDTQRPQAGPDLPSDAEIDRVMTFVEKLFRRFMAMVETLRPEPPAQPSPDKL